MREITPEIEAMAGDAPPGYSSGGMVTKLAAARIAMAAGCRMVIAHGPTALHPLARDRGRRARDLVPARGRAAARRASAGSPARSTRSGALVVDDGAAAALRRGKSLLPAGVVAVEGAFERGDAVVVRSRDGRELGARALAPMPATTPARIAGHKSGEIEAILGYRGRDEMIHRDDLVVTEAMTASR